jgi:ABC-type Fe3+/spermidine/putrescine transport system ATPase subunit
MKSIVTVNHLTKRFGEVTAVDDLSLEIGESEFFTMLGPSGCGKTTTLRCIAGLETADTGEISIGGTSVFSSRSRAEVPTHKRQIGMVFQSYAVWPHMSVFENIGYPLKIRGANRATIAKRVDAVLEVLNMTGLGQRMPSQLSGGQQQRVALGRALAVEPRVLLLDEPLSNLDAKLRDQMRAELKRIQRETALPIIYVTHDQIEALAMSDRVGVMSKGRLQQVDTPDRIYNEPVNGFVASFVGENSILEGGLEPSDGRRPRFTTADGPIACVAGPGLTSATRTKLYIRPETIRIGDDQTNTLPVLVSSVIFEGNVVSVIGRTQNGAELTSQFTNRPGLALPAVGEQIKFTFAADAAKVLKVD